MLSIKKTTLAASLLFLTASPISNARTRVDNHLSAMMSEVNLESQVMEGVIVYYNPDNRRINLETVRQVLRESKSMIGPEVDNCQNLTLKLFLLPDSVINNRDVMSFLVWELWGNQSLWGVYDSFHEPSVGEMYVNTNIPTSTMNMTIAHEYFHYRQDIRCVRKDEQEARNFEIRFCEISSTC
jgi:hypothetical protein